jgi:hypothetical protein
MYEKKFRGLLLQYWSCQFFSLHLCRVTFSGLVEISAGLFFMTIPAKKMTVHVWKIIK